MHILGAAALARNKQGKTFHERDEIIEPSARAEGRGSKGKHRCTSTAKEEEEKSRRKNSTSHTRASRTGASPRRCARNAVRAAAAGARATSRLAAARAASARRSPPRRSSTTRLKPFLRVGHTVDARESTSEKKQETRELNTAMSDHMAIVKTKNTEHTQESAFNGADTHLVTGASSDAFGALRRAALGGCLAATTAAGADC